MEADSLFSTLLQWLASATGDEAKTGGVPLLNFTMPEVPPKNMVLNPNKPGERFCCSMGKLGSSLDPKTMWDKPHTIRPGGATTTANLIGTLVDTVNDEGGTVGFVYTRHGGFIDLGHAHDFIDYTNYFAARYLEAAKSQQGETKLFDTVTKAGTFMGSIYLIGEQSASPPDYALCALIGAKLAYEYSLWHEIESYFTIENYSSFAPEDLFSNAVGVLVGFRALTSWSGVYNFDRQAHTALKHVIELLGPVDQETTEAATQYVKDHWWGPTGTLKRNFSIEPWLVTDLTIGGLESRAAELAQTIGKPKAASITIPSHNDAPHGRRAHLEFRDLHKDIKKVVGLDKLTSFSIRPVTSTMLRDHARNEEGPTIDQP